MSRKRKQDRIIEDKWLEETYQPLDGYYKASATQRRRNPAVWFVLLGISLIIFIGWIILAARQSSPVLPTTAPQLTQPTETVLSADATLYPPANQARGIYDEAGNLIKILDQNSNEVIEQATRQAFPIHLDTGESEQDWKVVSAEAINELASLEGVYYDESAPALVLIGEPRDASQRGLRLDDLLVALRSAYTGSPLGVSIDPGPTWGEMVVRYIGPSNHTHFGEVMFEADRTMKILGLGVDNETGQPVIVNNISEHQSLLELHRPKKIPQSGVGQEIRQRFWIVVDEATLATDASAAAIEDLRFHINTEYLDSNWQPLPPPAPTDPLAQKFAAGLAKNYARYASQFQAFAELEDLARMVSISQWLYEENILPNDSILLSAAIDSFPATQTTPAITVTQTITNASRNSLVTYTWEIYGGVDLNFRNKEKPDHGSPQITTEAANARPTKNTKSWSFKLGRRALRAVTIPLKAIQKLGAYRYTVAPARLQSGPLVFEPRYDSFQVQASELGIGWISGLFRLSFPAPRAEYNSLGQLYPAIYLLDPRDNRTLIFQGPLVEEVTNRILYQRIDNADEAIAVTERGGYEYINQAGETLTFDSAGRLINIRAGEGSFELTYNQAGGLESIRTATDERRIFQYNPQGRLIQVLDGDKKLLASFLYDDYNRLSEVRVSDGKQVSAQAYDSISRLLAHWAKERLLIYDWGNGSRVYLADRGKRRFVELFGPAVLERLAGASLLAQQDGFPGTVVFLQMAGPVALLMINDTTLELPVSTVKDPIRLRDEIKKYGLLPQSGSVVLIADGDGDKVNFSAVFQEATVLDSEALNQDVILRNNESTKGARLSQEVAFIFVSLPENENEMLNLSLDRDDPQQWQPEFWKNGKETIEEAVQKAGYDVVAREWGKSINDQFIQALSDKLGVIIIVAHSDEKKIYFPDKSEFDPDALTQEQKEKISKKQPIILLFACENAKIIDYSSLAKKLVDLGARLVVAPTSRLPVSVASEILQRFLSQASQEDVLTALTKVLRELQVQEIIRKLIGLDSFLGRN